jgi:glutamine amidotransferase
VYDNAVPVVDREAWDAYQNEAFRDAAARIYSKAVIAHVRRATVGVTSIENTHPFVHGEWSLAHNGTIPHFDAIRGRMLDHMTAEHRGAIAGQTDSEHIFRLFLSRLDERTETAEDALAAVATRLIGWCRELDRGARIGLNVLVTDGRSLVGLRWGRSLFYVERSGVTDCEVCRYPHVLEAKSDGYRSLVVASEPLTHGEAWQEVPEGSVFTATMACTLRFRSLGLETEPPLSVPARDMAEPVRSTLVDEFMVDHRALAEGLQRLVAAIAGGDVDAARAEADRIDRNSGAHIAFEESDLYPAIGAEASMYEEHTAGLELLQSVSAREAGFSPSDQHDLVGEAEAMLDHMEDCGVLLYRVRTLSPLVQSQLEDRLYHWRDESPRWSEVAGVRSAR